MIVSTARIRSLATLRAAAHLVGVPLAAVQFAAVLFMALQLATTQLPAQDDIAAAAQRVFAKHCVRCHGNGRVRGDVDLLRHRGLDQKRRIVPGAPTKSRLFQAITHTGTPHMPPKEAKLDSRDIATVRAWIVAGAPRPSSAESAPQPAHTGLDIQDADRDYWAFRPLRRPPVPSLDDDWSRTPIDRFVTDAQRAAGLAPNTTAPDATLIRRMSFGVTGLPPTPEQLRRDPDELVDELLESPHYGERWGRHWLDVARFGESTGYEADQDRRYAYKYRDAVIRALNEDLPFREFVRWQIAGDEFEPDNPTAIALTGFLAAGPTITNEGGDRVKYEKLDDIVSTTGAAFLGLTIGCARCHDHKYDPITQRDYYEMVGVFLSCRETDVPLTADARTERDRLQREQREARDAFNKWRNEKRQLLRTRRIEALPIDAASKQLLLAKRDRKNQPQEALFRKFDRKLRISDRDMEKELPEAEVATMRRMREDQRRADEKLRAADKHMGRVMVEGSPRAAQNFLLGRGDFRNKSEKIGYGFLAALRPASVASEAWFEAPPKGARTPWRRRAFAHWITDTKRGAGSLLARVLVNRLWQHHFGRGIVRTSGNFGITGDAPSHPKLLDWLACELVENDWSLKHLHRLILRSSVYRQGGESDTARDRIDPDNRLWWRRTPNRIEAEVWRDSVLAVSGKLNPQMFGPSIKPWMPTDAITTGSTRKWPVNVQDGPATWRRSIYIYTKRSILMPMLESLDFPDSTVSCSVRNSTTVAPAALLMMNNAFLRDQAKHLAARVVQEAGGETVDRVRRVYGLALGRTPDQSELARGVEFLETQRQSHPGKDAAIAALTNYAQVIFALNEFLYID